VSPEIVGGELFLISPMFSHILEGICQIVTPSKFFRSRVVHQ